MMLTEWINHEIAVQWSWALLDFLWQGFAIAGIMAIALRLCIRQHAVRYICGLFALTVCLLCPITNFVLKLVPSGIAVDELFIAVSPVASHENIAPAILQTPRKFEAANHDSAAIAVFTRSETRTGIVRRIPIFRANPSTSMRICFAVFDDEAIKWRPASELLNNRNAKNNWNTSQTRETLPMIRFGSNASMPAES